MGTYRSPPGTQPESATASASAAGAQVSKGLQHNRMKRARRALPFVVTTIRATRTVTHTGIQKAATVSTRYHDSCGTSHPTPSPLPGRKPGQRLAASRRLADAAPPLSGRSS